MDILTLLASQLEVPGGLWSSLINWLHGGIGNFGWTVLLVSIFVKIIVSPLEFMTKLSSKKQMLAQQKCAPQLAKIKKKYGKDANSIRIQQNALYKREGVNAGAGCLLMIINMVISLTVFFSFLGALNKNSAYQAVNQFEQLSTVYTQKNYELIQQRNDEINGFIISSEDNAKQFLWDCNIGFKLNELIEQDKRSEIKLSEDKVTYYTNLYNDNKIVLESITKDSFDVVIKKWNSSKSSWLWVDNIWVSDATIYPFPVYDNFMELVKSGGYTDYIEKYVENINKDFLPNSEEVTPENDISMYIPTFEDYYNTISTIVITKSARKNNGFFILAILVGVITFLSQYLSERTNKLKNEKAKLMSNNLGDSMQTSMKVMKIILPIVMISFVLKSSASFGIHLLAGNIVSIIVNEVSTIIINKMTHKQQLEVEEYLEKEANRLIKKGKLQENK